MIRFKHLLKEVKVTHDMTSNPITKGLNDKNPLIRQDAIQYPNATADHITKALSDENYKVRYHAIRHPNATADHVTKALNDENPRVRAEAIRHSSATTDHITKALSDEDSGVRYNAIIHPKVTTDHITKALNDKDPFIKQTAQRISNKKTVKLHELHSRSHLDKIINHLKGQDDNKDDVYNAKQRSKYLKFTSDHLKNSREASTSNARDFDFNQARQALSLAKYFNKKIPKKKMEYDGTKISLTDYENKLKGHDWTYKYSDDNRVFKKGAASESEIVHHSNQSKEHKALYDKYRLREEREMR